MFSSIDKLKQIPEITEDVKKFFEQQSLAILDTSKHLEKISLDYDLGNSKALEFAQGIRDGSIQLKEGQTMLAGYQSYLKSTGKTAQFANLKTQALTVSMKVLSTIGWMVAFTAAIKVIEATVKGIDNLIHRMEHLAKVANKSKEAYNSMTGEIESINSELRTTSQRIDELNGKENLSLVEQDELNKLKTTNDELERELEIKQRLANITKKQASEDAEAYFKESKSYGYDNRGDSVSVQGNIVDVTGLQIQHYQMLQDEIKKTKAQMDGIIASNPEGYKRDSDYQGLANVYDGLIYQSDELEKNISSNITTFMELDDSLDSSSRSGKVLLDSLTQVYSEFDKVFKGVGQNTTNIIDNVFSRPTLEATKESLISLGKQGTLSVDSLKTKFGNLITELNEAGVSAEELLQYIMALANPDAVNVSNVKKELYSQFVTPYEGTDETDWNRVTQEYDDWINSKSDEEILVIYEIKKGTDTSGWSFEDFDKEIENRQNIKIDVSTNFSLSEEQSKSIDDFQTKVKSLGSAISSLQDGTEVDMTDLIQEFPTLMTATGDLETSLKNLIDEELKNLIELLGEDAPQNLSNSLIKLAENARDTNKSLSDSFATIQSSFDVLETFKKEMSEGFTDSTLSSVAKLSDGLNTLVAGFYAGAVSADELYSALSSHYQTDLENYGNALIAKNSANEAFYNAVGLNSAELCNAFSDAYGVDISNCKNYNQAKIEIERQTLQTISEMWAKYYNAQAGSFTDAYRALEDDIFSGNGANDPEAMRVYNGIKEQASAYQKALNGLNNIVYDNVGANFDGINSKFGKGGSKDGKGSSKEDTKKDFDWIDRKLQLLEDKRAELEEKASSSALSYLGLSESDMAKAQELLEKFGSQAKLTGSDITSLGDLASKTGMFIGDFINVLKDNGIDSRKGYLSQQLEIEKEILAERQKATQQYLAKYEETVSKLPDDLRQKVANGGDDIETLTGDEATYAQEAIDARDKYLESLENEDQAKQNLIETTKKSYELELDYLDQQADRLNHQNTMIEKQIDLLNASGQMVNISSYEQILSNMRRQEEILNKKIAQKKKEMQALLESGYIEEDSEEYFQMQQYIESCEESLVDLAIEQEEYNDKIRQLPIENMQKVINMYEDISNALQDYANVLEASGKKLDAEYFQRQIANGKETIAQYKEQAELIRDIMDEYEVGSDKYTEMYNKLQDINSAISNIAQNMHEWNKELLALPLNSIDNRLDGLGNVLSALQDVQSDHEVVINAVTRAIQKQIEALEEQRDLGVESAQAEIDALQEKLDLLQEQNKERQIQLALEQARYDLERAQNQKTNKVVRDGIIDYEADQDAIRNANQSKADAEYNKVVHDLEKQKEALEDNLEAIEESYQKQIDLLNEMAEKWSKIKTDAEDTANASIADQYLGKGWQDKVTSGNDGSIYEAFKKSYETNNQMVQKYEKQIESTEKIYNLLNSYIAAYQAGTLSYEEAMSSIKSLLSQMNKDMSAGQAVQNVIDYLAKVNDTEANADAVLSGIQAQLKADSDEMIKNLEQYNENLDLIAGCMTSWEQLTSNIGDIRNLMDKVIDSIDNGFDDLADALGDYSRRRDEEEDDDDYGDHSSGTVSPGGTSNDHYTGNDVNTSGSQDNDHGPGVKSYAKGIENGAVGSKIKITPEEFEQLQRGADESIRRLKNGEVPIIAHEGEVVFNPDQQRALLDNLNYYRQRSFMIPSSQGMSLISEPRETNVEINVGGITLTDARNADSLVKDLVRNFEPAMRQNLSIWKNKR